MIRTRIRQVSKKRASEQRERRKRLREAYPERPMCVRCGKPADDAHEVLSRAQGGSITDMKNIVPLDRECHDYLTTHPKEAAEEGLLVSRKWSAK